MSARNLIRDLTANQPIIRAALSTYLDRLQSELAMLIRPGAEPHCCDTCYSVWAALTEAAQTIEDAS